MLLFNIALDPLIRALEQSSCRYKFNSDLSITSMAYMDDLAVCSSMV